MEIDIEKCEFITKYYDCRICNGKSLRIHCRDNTNCYYKKLQQLKATLDEIEEICEINICNICQDTDCDTCLMGKILQKIKKVKD